MTRQLAAVLTVLAAVAAPARADSIFFDGLPAAFVPGEAFTFTVGLPPITDLGSYDIDVVLTGDGVAGTDFAFNLAATEPVALVDGYVFPSNTNFFDAVNTPAANEQRLTVTDFDFGGADVVTGVNDRTASVVVDVAPGFTGLLSLSIDADSLILDSSATAPTPVAEFSDIVQATLTAGAVDLPAIPEPASLTLACLALLAVRRRF